MRTNLKNLIREVTWDKLESELGEFAYDCDKNVGDYKCDIVINSLTTEPIVVYKNDKVLEAEIWNDAIEEIVKVLLKKFGTNYDFNIHYDSSDRSFYLYERYRISEPTLYTLILNYGIATEKELELVTDIWGMNKDTLNKVIFSRTGYRDIAQYEESECD